MAGRRGLCLLLLLLQLLLLSALLEAVTPSGERGSAGRGAPLRAPEPRGRAGGAPVLRRRGTAGRRVRLWGWIALGSGMRGAPSSAPGRLAAPSGASPVSGAAVPAWSPVTRLEACLSVKNVKIK